MTMFGMYLPENNRDILLDNLLFYYISGALMEDIQLSYLVYFMKISSRISYQSLIQEKSESRPSEYESSESQRESESESVSVSGSERESQAQAQAQSETDNKASTRQDSNEQENVVVVKQKPKKKPINPDADANAKKVIGNTTYTTIDCQGCGMRTQTRSKGKVSSKVWGS